ncbi:molybdopterin molybdenumtransferase MoeA [Undibacterium sp. LX40W]|uniref:Molybdopterin molybdenumtransferase n=1 Tax=Undibacterium nitidum TaxID=2762298 RepID=A0A923HQV2_9BURK|nr:MULTISPECIES: gephyrin-like molybdotransferase Glp [Undibacterium]MBC3882278.1 molybdopterin molybdenumtransferase MoeA [Undibacterium nitidum]MBC3892559.1 molybdopterin molybdenumtransferase MoeA [Undibacterium sp. LX40W]
MQSFHPSLSTILDQHEQFRAPTLSVQDTKNIIEKFITPITEVDNVGIFDSLGRVLAEDIISPFNVPPHDNSAMDGFAFNSEQLKVSTPLKLTIIGESFAGRPFHGHVNLGECVKIMTGAVMPTGCDTVVPQEMTTCSAIDIKSQQEISFDGSKLRLGDNRRFAGEDLVSGQIAICKGKRLGAAELGLIASLGIAKVSVYRRLRVAYFSTGDEVRSLGEALTEGSIYDSNRYTVFALLKNLGIEMIDLGVAPDHPDALETTLRQACQAADAVITSGGVSVGAADYTKEVMARMGEVAFWTIGMRPGRPMAFGRISHHEKSAYLFGLPGNPVAVMVSFLYFVRDALLHMQSAQAQTLLLVPARSLRAIRKRQGRTEYQRGIANIDDDGQLQVQVTGSQGSGVLRSMAEANCMIVLPDEQADVAAGTWVKIHLFDGLLR